MPTTPKGINQFENLNAALSHAELGYKSTILPISGSRFFGIGRETTIDGVPTEFYVSHGSLSRKTVSLTVNFIRDRQKISSSFYELDKTRKEYTGEDNYIEGEESFRGQHIQSSLVTALANQMGYSDLGREQTSQSRFTVSDAEVAFLQELAYDPANQTGHRFPPTGPDNVDVFDIHRKTVDYFRAGRELP